MAERQGLLTGPYLCQVQTFSLSLLMLIQKIEQNKAIVDAVKIAMISSGKREAEEFFPDLFTAETTDEIPESSEVPVSYEFTNSDQEYDQAKIEEEIRQMMEKASLMSSTFDLGDPF